MPSTGAQQLVSCRHGTNAPVESHYEFGHRLIPNGSLGNHGADGRECVLDTMVELGHQCTFASLRHLALGNVEIVSEHAARFPGRFVVEGLSHLLDPSNFAVRTDDAKLEIELITAADGGVPLGFDPLQVIGIDAAAKIRVTLYGTGLETKDGLELGGEVNLARAQVPIP